MRTTHRTAAQPAQKAARLAALSLMGALALTCLGAGAAHADGAGSDEPTATVVPTRDVHDWG